MVRVRCSSKEGVQLLTRMKVIDNSVPARTVARVAFVFQKRRTAVVGDMIKVACMGKMQNALVTSTRGKNRVCCSSAPAFGENTCVLLNKGFEPIGTRIRGPLPAYLRSLGPKTVKICAMATTFV